MTPFRPPPITPRPEIANPSTTTAGAHALEALLREPQRRGLEEAIAKLSPEQARLLLDLLLSRRRRRAFEVFPP